jgi:phage tail-like protein
MLLVDDLRQLANASFRFVVEVDAIPLGAFTECTLPTLELETEEIKEGGLNTYVHQLPGRRKASKVVLKNGVGIATEIMAWYLKSMRGEFSRRSVTITLLSPRFIPIMVWSIQDAYPNKWTGPNLKSDDNTVAIQALELVCGDITVV